MSGVAPLAGEWVLWRDFAVRSAGFPVTGLDAFGPGDEPGRLAAVAADPLFGEAVTWQNRAAYANAVAKVAAGSPTKPSRARQREEVVASYWQRYCAKNDTIGFFGPLAWGRITDDGPPLHARCGALVARRDVHFEAWAIQQLSSRAILPSAARVQMSQPRTSHPGPVNGRACDRPLRDPAVRRHSGRPECLRAIQHLAKHLCGHDRGHGISRGLARVAHIC